MQRMLFLLVFVFVSCVPTSKIIRVGSPLEDHYVRVFSSDGFCSGVYLLVKKESHILTAAHCTDLGYIYVVGHRGQHVSGKTIAHNIFVELSLIKLDEPLADARPATISTIEPKIGDSAYSIGLGGELYVGNFEEIDYELGKHYKCEMLSYASEPGMSGTGVYNSRGELTGIITHEKDTVFGYRSLSTKWAKLVEFIKDVENDKNVDGFDELRDLIREIYGDQYCTQLCPCQCD
jgi:hypothetical protein